MEPASKTLKRVILELDGKDPAIIGEDVDIDEAAPRAIVEGIKGCQMAGHFIGKAWQREEKTGLETRYVESLLVVYMCVHLCYPS